MIDNNATIQVKGMRCDDCVRRVAESLLGVEGVDDVEVDLERGEARVQLNENEPAERDELERAVADAGFVADRVEMP